MQPVRLLGGEGLGLTRNIRLSSFYVTAWKNKKDGTRVIADDPYLEPFQDSLRYRYVSAGTAAAVQEICRKPG